jgi:DNA-binding MarR family transcriptional regulator
MKEFQLKTPHVACIYYLYSKGTMTAKDLSDICDEDKAAISRALIYLEKKNYIFYESVARKRYKEPIMLTEKGKEVGKVIKEKIEEILQQSSNGLTSEELAIVYHGLSVIGKDLQTLCDIYEE